MKVKDLIKELEQYNPDGTVTLQINRDALMAEAKAEDVKPDGCGMINVLIIGVE
jgi:hypothetical protein